MAMLPLFSQFSWLFTLLEKANFLHQFVSVNPQSNMVVYIFVKLCLNSFVFIYSVFVYKFYLVYTYVN